jgi:hypothetical protein
MIPDKFLYWFIVGGHLAFTIAYYAWHMWHGRPH